MNLITVIKGKHRQEETVALDMDAGLVYRLYWAIVDWTDETQEQPEGVPIYGPGVTVTSLHNTRETAHEAGPSRLDLSGPPAMLFARQFAQMAVKGGSQQKIAILAMVKKWERDPANDAQSV